MAKEQNRLVISTKGLERFKEICNSKSLSMTSVVKMLIAEYTEKEELKWQQNQVK